MIKINRIKKFVTIDIAGNSIKSKNHSKLYEKLVQNLHNEYLSYHQKQIAASKTKCFKTKESNFDLNINCEKFRGFLNDIKSQKNSMLPFVVIRQNNKEDAVIKMMHFVSETQSHEHFYKLQRQHKILWREIGTSPDKYSVSDQKSLDGITEVTLRSSIVDPSIELEKLSLISMRDKKTMNGITFKIPERNSEIIPDIIETSFNLHKSSLSILLDANQLSSSFLALHRRISPYQFAIIVQNSANRDLVELAAFVELLIRETDSSLEVLNLGNETAGNCENIDQIGIPYHIILDETTLENGILKLRNRNTTLSESFHLSNVRDYLIKIIKS